MLEALVAFFLVTVVMLLLGQSFPFSLAIGSIACATAPAATLMVIKQYKAEGPLVRHLYQSLHLMTVFVSSHSVLLQHLLKT